LLRGIALHIYVFLYEQKGTKNGVFAG